MKTEEAYKPSMNVNNYITFQPYFQLHWEWSGIVTTRPRTCMMKLYNSVQPQMMNVIPLQILKVELFVPNLSLLLEFRSFAGENSHLIEVVLKMHEFAQSWYK